MSFKDHPKSKGANFKIKKPLNMELEEGDRPNIVTRFNQKNDNAIYLVQTTQLPNYNAKQYFKELIIDNEAVKEWSLEYLAPLKSSYSANYISSEAEELVTYSMKKDIEE